MVKYTEILRLANILMRKRIPFYIHELFNGWQICYPTYDLGGRVCSVIEHDGSYGRENDQLEIMGLLTPDEQDMDDVLGYLTADEVAERIEKHYTANK